MVMMMVQRMMQLWWLIVWSSGVMIECLKEWVDSKHNKQVGEREDVYDEEGEEEKGWSLKMLLLMVQSAGSLRWEDQDPYSTSSHSLHPGHHH